ncbi:hypothetical protein NDN08_000964 [Rhodosorus marinus]|uniref:DNA replication complex GINS protein PSF1 n=1 Tax=Rhodosorus marinus TaxID=101924 RepID=A0AAV8UPK9_9RHOD|nr:hypothetical protein NDN08_000964 [Rhodosorus marinus]
MFGSVAADLVRELKNSKWLLPFNESSLRTIAIETRSIMEMITSTVSQFREKLDQPEVLATVMVFHRSVQRNKRCVLAYLYKRLERMRRMRWEYSSINFAELSNNLSMHERDYLSKYNRLLGEYCESVGLDLTAELQPPKDLYIEVRVLKDCGSILTDSGTVNLKSGTAHFLPRVDVEHLVRQGALEHVI